MSFRSETREWWFWAEFIDWVTGFTHSNINKGGETFFRNHITMWSYNDNLRYRFDIMFYEWNNASFNKNHKITSLASFGKFFILFFGSLHDGSGSPYCLSPGLPWLRCAPPCRPQDSIANAAAFGGLNKGITFTSRVLWLSRAT